MNESQKSSEIKYLPRWIQKRAEQAIQDHPIVVMTGARQVGKSTFLKHSPEIKDWRYLSFDNFDVLGQAQSDPASLWAGTQHVIMDEVQKVPQVLASIKQAVDSHPRQFKFVLSGSANLLLMQKVSESLAGRAIYLSMMPMTLGEMAGHPAPDILENLLQGQFPAEGDLRGKDTDPIKKIMRGLMPALMPFSSADSVATWWEGYVATFLERDLRQMSQVHSLIDFKRVMQAIALRSGQLFHQSDLGREVGVSQPSIHRYLHLLEMTSVIHQVPAYSRNRNKRLIKSPKFYWMDPSLAAHLSGYYDESSLGKARELGGFMETFMFHHLQALAQLLIPRPQIFYWRTTDGYEVDFVLEYGRRLMAIEVKLTTTARYSDCENLKLFLKEYPETQCAVLIYSGRKIQRLTEQIIALPWTLFCGI